MKIKGCHSFFRSLSGVVHGYLNSPDETVSYDEVVSDIWEMVDYMYLQPNEIEPIVQAVQSDEIDMAVKEAEEFEWSLDPTWDEEDKQMFHIEMKLHYIIAWLTAFIFAAHKRRLERGALCQSST